MKNLLVFTLIFIFGKVLIAQEYYNFPNDSTIWNEVHVGIAIEPWEQDTYHTISYLLLGDTTINSFQYSKLYYSAFCDSSFLDIDNYEFVGGIREDSTKRIYFFRDSVEHLLYDFNLNVGDTFNITFDGHIDEEIATVFKVDSILINEVYRKQIHLQTILGWTDPWVEGIGSLTSPIDYVYPYGNFGVGISCIYQKSKLIYNSGIECCMNTSSAGSLIKNEIKIYPNPSSGLITIDLQETKVYTEYELINSQGKVILNDKIRDQVIWLNLENYNSGVYILKLIGRNYIESVKLLLN